MILKKDIIGSCNVCAGTGELDHSICECMIKFRALNFLQKSGFSEYFLNFVSGDSYEVPIIESGESFVNYFIDNPEFVDQNGLSLYLYSKERGRGKTTLAHYLAYSFAKYFSTTESYSRSRNYGFQTIYDLLDHYKTSNLHKKFFYVLDDLGNEDKTISWKKELCLSILQEVLQYRRRNKMITIITSNFEPSAISRDYQGVLDSLLEIKPDGCLGGEYFRSVELGGGEDLRLDDSTTKWPI